MDTFDLKESNNKEVKPTEKETSNIKMNAHVKNKKVQKTAQVKTGDTTISLYLVKIIIMLLGIVSVHRKKA